MGKDYKLYSLLHIHGNNKSNVNLKSSISDALDTYILCGILLSKSCRKYNIDYSIITNEPEILEERIDVLGGGVKVVRGNFFRDVPENINFYSAHYKLDVIKAFGDGDYGDNVGLIDLDMVLINDIDFGEFLNDKSALFVYNITDQVEPAVGEKKLLKSLQKMDVPVSKNPQWYGGEFIFGRKEVFHELYEKIQTYWINYTQCYGSLHHVGDEMIVTAALNDLKHVNYNIIDIGSALVVKQPVVARWWSSRTLGKQISLSQALTASFLHLPSDKKFLAKMARKDFKGKKFVLFYTMHAIVKIAPRQVLNIFDNIIMRKGRKLYVSRLF